MNEMEYLEGLVRYAKNKKVKEILNVIIDSIPDFGYMDYNDREYFYETEYEDLIDETLNKLEEIIWNAEMIT